MEKEKGSLKKAVKSGAAAGAVTSGALTLAGLRSAWKNPRLRKRIVALYKQLRVKGAPKAGARKLLNNASKKASAAVVGVNTVKGAIAGGAVAGAVYGVRKGLSHLKNRKKSQRK